MRRNLCVMALAMLLLPDSLQFVDADNPLEQTDDRTTGNPFDIYDTQSSEEFFDPMKQPLRAYQDFLRTNAREYITAEPIVTLDPTKVSTDETTDTTLVDGVDESTTAQSDLRSTTVESADIDETDNGPQPLPYAAELTSKKQGKMFVPQFDTIEIPRIQVYSDNTIHVADQLLANKNETNDSSVKADEESQSNESSTLYATTTAAATSAVPALARRVAAKKIVETTTHIYKYSADEILRKYLEDQYIRSPMAAVVYTASDALRKAQLLWKSALRPNAAIDIVLLAYNAADIGVTYSFKNTRNMIAGLDSVPRTDQDNGGTAFFCILRAAELVPYDSAIFISTDSIPVDTNLAKYTAITLQKKRIRLYLIWFGPQATDDNEAIGQNNEGGTLGEVALQTGGQVLRVSEEALGPNGNLELITYFLSNEIHGAQELPTIISASGAETATLNPSTGG